MDRGIQRFSEAVTDYRPIWPVIADDFYAEEAAQFKTEGAEGGDKWAPLSEEYAGWKEAHYPGQPILQRTGDLVASLTKQSDPNAVYRPERKTLTLGSKVTYGIYHQSIQPRKALPRRPEIMLTEAFKRGVMAHIHGYLVQVGTQSGFRRGLTPLQVSTLQRLQRYGKAPHGFAPRRRDEHGRFIGG